MALNAPPALLALLKSTLGGCLDLLCIQAYSPPEGFQSSRGEMDVLQPSVSMTEYLQYDGIYQIYLSNNTQLVGLYFIICSEMWNV